MRAQHRTLSSLSTALGGILVMFVVLVSQVQPTPVQAGGDALQTAPRAQQVVKFTLVKAGDDVEVGELSDGDVIDCALLKAVSLNVRADTLPAIVGSVRFAYDTNPNFNTENSAPYFLARNNGPDWNGWTPVDGVHTITAQPFSQRNATGTAGIALSVTFTAASCSTSPTPSPTNTGTLSVTPMSTPVLTATPTLTPTAQFTVMPSATATVSPTPITATSTNAATESATATATSTPTASLTGVVSVELLKNGGFETDDDGDNIPDFWLQKNASGDKRKCNKDKNGDGIDDKIVAVEGHCVYRSRVRQAKTANFSRRWA